MTSQLLSHCVLLNKQCAPRSNNFIAPCIYQRFDSQMMHGFQWLLSCVFLIAAFTGFHNNSVSSLSAKFGEKLESRYETSFYNTQTRHYFIVFLLSYIINTSDGIRFKLVVLQNYMFTRYSELAVCCTDKQFLQPKPYKDQFLFPLCKQFVEPDLTYICFNKYIRKVNKMFLNTLRTCESLRLVGSEWLDHVQR